MGLIKTILDKFGYYRTKEIPVTQQPPAEVFAEGKGVVGPLKDDLTIYRSMRQLLARFDEVTQPYSQSIWVYASVSTIANCISRVPFTIVKWFKKEKRIIEDGPMYQLFQRPNPLMSPEQLWEATMIYMGLRGEAMWIMERANVTAMPEEIWVFDPQRFTAIYSEKSGIPIGWRYRGKGNEEIDFAPWEVLHFKYFNPDNDIRGLAPLQAAKMGIDQDYYASLYNEAFFKDGATVGGFIEVPESLDDKQFERLKNQFEERHKGYRRAHRIGIIEGGAKFTEAKLSQKDMDFVSLKKITREEVFAAYKTNAVVLGLYDQIQSYEGIKTAHRAFWVECLVPKMKYIVGVVNSKFITPVLGANILGEFDLATVEALQEDFNKKIETGHKMALMGWPINAINDRLELGMAHVPWGDVWWAPISVVPVTGPEAPEFPGTASAGKTQGKTVKSPGGSLQGEEIDDEQKEKQALVISATGLVDDPRIGAIWRNFIVLQSVLEKRCKTALKTYFFGQRKRVLERLYDKFGNKSVGESVIRDLPDDLLVSAEEVAKLGKTMAPIYQMALKLGAESVATELGSSSFVFDPMEAEFQAYMAMKLRNIPQAIVETVTQRLRNTLSEGLSKGESVEQLAARVREEYNITASRAMTIARTETSTAANGGRFIQMKKEGVKKHQWITAKDEFVRPSHKLMDGAMANIGEKFINNVGIRTQLRYPGDLEAPASEVINCRCLSIPVVSK